MPKYVSINGHTVRSNARNGICTPPIRIARTRTDSNPIYASEVEILGGARLLHDPEKAIMRCGARLVLVCDDVKVIRLSLEPVHRVLRAFARLMATADQGRSERANNKRNKRPLVGLPPRPRARDSDNV
jgi:hypothetical protein